MGRLTRALQDEDVRTKLFVGSITGVFAIFNICLAVCGVTDVFKAWKSVSWASTEGQIRISEMVTSSDSQFSPTYSPKIHYTYRVADQEYTGTRIFFGDGWSSSNTRATFRYLGRYPVGRRVSVFYNHQEPSSAVLEPGLARKSWRPLVFHLGFAIACISIFAYFILKWRPSNRLIALGAGSLGMWFLLLFVLTWD